MKQNILHIGLDVDIQSSGGYLRCINAKLRKLIVPKNKKPKNKGSEKGHNKTVEGVNQDKLVAPLTWAQRLKRVFNIDITLCPICGGTVRVIADITDPDIIQKILDQLEAQPPPIKTATTSQP